MAIIRTANNFFSDLNKLRSAWTSLYIKPEFVSILFVNIFSFYGHFLNSLFPFWFGFVQFDAYDCIF